MENSNEDTQESGQPAPHPNLSDMSSVRDESHLTSVRRIVKSFIHRVVGDDINHHYYQSPPTDVLQTTVIAELECLGIPPASVQRWTLWACQVAENFYPGHPLELKALIAICNIAIFHTDDVLASHPERLNSYQLHVVKRTHSGDIILDCLTRVLIPRMWDHYHPLVASVIAIGFYDFIAGTSMETFTKSMVHNSSAPCFPEYIRLKSGIPAPYAYWLFYTPEKGDISSYIQAIPDLLGFINRVNDVLSFYKEELAGEDDNFVHMRAKLLGCSVPSALERICDEVIQLMSRIFETLSEYPDRLAVFKAFVPRYIRFHVSTTRYQLDELLQLA